MTLMTEPLCTGRGAANGDHCCYPDGVRCQFLVENVEGRKYACGLMAELGDWDKVLTDPRYQPVQAIWDRTGLYLTNGSSCKTWQPEAGQCCRGDR